MEITSYATRTRLAKFQLEGESQVWWDWVKISRNLEAMTWGYFCTLFMSKFFPASTRHAKAQEFLELRQGAITVLEYMAKFIELARFTDDYVATDRVVTPSPLAQERSRGLLLYEGFKGRVVTPRDTTPKVKAKINHPNMGGTLGLLAN